MPNLHAHYYHGNVKAFRQELDGTGAGAQAASGGGGGGKGLNPGSASGGRSWTLGGMAMVHKADPNERDQQGRTVLHLAASSLAPQAYTFFTILLRSANLSVNLQDHESGYTALHRALFTGNIRAARDLLARADTDASIRDAEGLTAYDLYNGTVDGTNPSAAVEHGTDLYVWGANRNFALGTGDSSDKAWPDRINLQTQAQAAGRADPADRFVHVGVRDVRMAKLHTGALTTEARGNLSLSGFGSGGRLGRSVHSQLALAPLPDLPHTVTALALGQDHSLALTAGGYVLSWGNNRFSQLGYAIDPADRPSAPFVKDGDELVQVSPKRIVGPLKKEFVRGVAAGRMSSACWTADAVWTWGTNAGHLGYEKAANPVQLVPRKVTAISQPVVDVALSDYAMICLVDGGEVVCFHHDTHFRINFTTPRILSEAFPFRPRQSTLRPSIKKVTSSGQTFAALSTIGDVFMFQLPNPAEDVSKEARDRHVSVKPQLIWALRKNFTAVKDVALGGDGTVIICTHSGHVFVRQRAKAGGALKFKRVPYLQRVIKVACNESGAFAAIRVDARPTSIALVGRTLEDDLALLQPHFHRLAHQMTADDFDRVPAVGHDEDEEDAGANSVVKDTAVAVRMCTILGRWKAADPESLFAWSESLLGSDITLVVGEHAVPAHSVVLGLRSNEFAQLLAGKALPGFRVRETAITIDACHPLVVLLLLQYIYADDAVAVWDARVARTLQLQFPDDSLPIGQIKADLLRLATALELAPLVAVLGAVSKTPLPRRTLPHDLQAFFGRTHADPDGSDVVIVLADREVACQSVILRARCPFFEAMFADRDWTLERREDGRVVVEMRHLRWRPMQLVFRYIHEGVEDDLFDYFHQETLDGFLDFVFEVLAAATELLMDRLVLVCSRAVTRHVNVYNAAALAAEATFYQATTLKRSIFDYIISCMETMLESGLLDEMDDDVLRDLCAVIAHEQEGKLPVPRSAALVVDAMDKHRDWLALQDIPAPRVRVPIRRAPPASAHRSPVLSPVELTLRMPASPGPSPDVKPVQSTNDDIFAMDDDVPSSRVAEGKVAASRPGTPGAPVWKSKTVEADKMDLRSIMAEAAAAKKPSRPPITPARRGPGSAPGSAVPPASPTVRPGIPGATPPGWRPVETRKTSMSNVHAQQASASASALAPSVPRASPAPPAVQRVSSARVITPVKLQSPPAGVSRRTSSGAAWATPQPSFAPPATPGSVSPSTAAQSLSLLAIQQEERAYAEQSVKRAPRSLMEIQEEERAAAEAVVKEREERDREEEFLRWWKEEERRAGGVGAMGGARGGGGGARGGKVARGRGGKSAGSGTGQSAAGPSYGTDAERGSGRGGRGGDRAQGRERAARGRGRAAPAATVTATATAPAPAPPAPARLNPTAAGFVPGTFARPIA
ncbi:hypothetical protein Q5752_000079 [Cryptotrichosporon argae]